MKCTNCGGALGDTMTFCPYCGVRADVDLRQIHFRDLGQDASLPCPECATPLGVIELQVEPPVCVERCPTCLGMFFNPGELPFLLDAQTNPLVWFDGTQLQQIATDFGHQDHIRYKKCPLCPEFMNRINFGGRSAVILDSCGTHGMWVEGTELRRLTEWWRAGGKLIFQQNEADKVKTHYATMKKDYPIHLPDTSQDATLPETPADIGTVIAGLATIAFSLLD